MLVDQQTASDSRETASNPTKGRAVQKWCDGSPVGGTDGSAVGRRKQ